MLTIHISTHQDRIRRLRISLSPLMYSKKIFIEGAKSTEEQNALSLLPEILTSDADPPPRLCHYWTKQKRQDRLFGNIGGNNFYWATLGLLLNSISHSAQRSELEAIRAVTGIRDRKTRTGRKVTKTIITPSVYTCKQFRATYLAGKMWSHFVLKKKPLPASFAKYVKMPWVASSAELFDSIVWPMWAVVRTVRTKPLKLTRESESNGHFCSIKAPLLDLLIPTFEEKPHYNSLEVDGYSRRHSEGSRSNLTAFCGWRGIKFARQGRVSQIFGSGFSPNTPITETWSIESN